MQFKHCDRFTVTFTIDLNISDSVKNFSIACNAKSNRNQNSKLKRTNKKGNKKTKA